MIARRGVLAALAWAGCATAGAGVEVVTLASTTSHYWVAPDGLTVVFATPANGQSAIYSTPIGGGSPIHLWTGVLSEADDVIISPDGLRVVIRARLTSYAFELLSVPTSGPANNMVQLTQMASNGAGVLHARWAITPDSSDVVFIGENEFAALNLHRVPIAGPASAALRLDQGPPFSDVKEFVLSPDSQVVYYRADRISNELFEIWSVPINGPASAVARVSGPIAGSYGAGGLLQAGVSPTGDDLVYGGDIERPQLFDLYSSPLPPTGGSSIRLSDVEPPSGEVSGFMIDPNGGRVVFKGHNLAGGMQIVSAPIRGPYSAGVELNTDTPGSVHPQFWGLTPNGGRVVYSWDAGFNLRYDIFSVPIEGPRSANVQLSPTIGDDDRVVGFEFSPDSQWVVFGIRFDGLSTNGYRAPADGSSAASEVWTHDCRPSEWTDWIRARPDGSAVVIRCASTNAPQTLWHVRIDGVLDLAPMRLLPPGFPLGGEGVRSEFAITPGSDWLVFQASPASAGPIGLFSRPLPYFWDGFESGGTGNWSDVQP